LVYYNAEDINMVVKKCYDFFFAIKIAQDAYGTRKNFKEEIEIPDEIPK
jgi:hypothetical protein